MKGYGHNRIEIKKKRKYFTLKNLIILSVILFSIFGIILFTIKIVVDNEVNKIKSDIMYQSEEDKIYGVIDSVSDSIVTISDDKDKLLNNTYNEGNISGVIINEAGYILTAYESIKGKNKLFVRLSGVANEAVEAKVIGSEEKTNIGIIKINENNLTPIKFSKYEDTKIGEEVFAVGNAVSASPIGIITPGVITSMDETVTDGNNNTYRLIGTNSIINKKNIGGILCNTSGELVGFNNISIKDMNNVGESYVLGVKAIENICEYIINLTDILGISGGNSICDEKSGVKGVYIQNIKKDGYAAKSGLLPTDIITAINGKKVETSEDLYFAIKDKKMGDTINCDFLRDGVKSYVEIKLS